MAWTELIQELIGSTGRWARRAEETGVYRYPPFYRGFKLVVSLASGIAVIALGVLHAANLSAFDRVLMVAVGCGLIGIAVSIARGFRQITVTSETLTIELGSGETRMWRLADLYAREPSRTPGVMFSVRERATGRRVLTVPRDLPGWEVLIGSITSAGAA